MARPPARRAREARNGLRRSLLVLGAALVLLLAPSPAAAAARRAAVDEWAVATLELSNVIFLEVQAGPRDSYVSLAQRYCGSEQMWAALEKANQGRRVRPGLFYAIPFESLTPHQRARAVAALFPEDGPEEEGWVHRVPDGDEGQLLQSIARWFTGDPKRADELAVSNGIPERSLAPGVEVVIPDEFLLPDFRDDARVSQLLPQAPPAEPQAGPPEEAPGAPQPTPPAPTVEPRPSGPRTVGELTFVDGPGEPHAIYRLKKGEALYSSVIMKFTGRLDPGEVTEVARRVSALSGIHDARSIPAGFAVKIPRDLVLPEYLPEGDPQRASYEAGLAAAGRHRITAQARDLQGVHIILDSGHGGDDIGARRNGVHEDDYVYDILCRIKKLAEQSTGARVLTTLRDKSSGFEPLSGPFVVDRDEQLLTNPAFELRKPHVTTAGVNLRWYLVNSYYRRLVKAGADPHRALACLICRCLASAEGCPHQGYLSADFECRLAVVVASPAGSLFAAGGMVLIRGRIPQRGADSSTPSSGSSCRSFGSSPQKEWCWRCRSRQFPSLGRRKMSRPRPAMHPCLHACDPEQAPAPIVGHPGWRQKPDWRLPDRRPGSGPMRM